MNDRDFHNVAQMRALGRSSATPSAQSSKPANFSGLEAYGRYVSGASGASNPQARNAAAPQTARTPVAV